MDLEKQKLEIKGALVHFYRNASKEDYLQALENAIEEIQTIKNINYTSCSEQLKDKKEMTFTEWLELNKYTRHTRDMFLDENGDYYYESLLLKIYKKEYSL